MIPLDPGRPGRPCSLFDPGSPCSWDTARYMNVQRFQGGLVCKAHRRLCHSTLGLRVIKHRRTRVSVPTCTLHPTLYTLHYTLHSELRSREAREAMLADLIRTSIPEEYDFPQGIGAFPSGIRPTAPIPWAGIVFLRNTRRD